MFGQRAGDHRIAVRPVADEGDDARLVEGLLHRLALDRTRFVRLARQAPVGGEIDENGRSGRARLGKRVGGEDRKSKRLNSRSLMRISYAVFCLKKKTKQHKINHIYHMCYLYKDNNNKNRNNIKLRTRR